MPSVLTVLTVHTVNTKYSGSLLRNVFFISQQCMQPAQENQQEKHSNRYFGPTLGRCAHGVHTVCTVCTWCAYYVYTRYAHLCSLMQQREHRSTCIHISNDSPKSSTSIAKTHMPLCSAASFARRLSTPYTTGLTDPIYALPVAVSATLVATQSVAPSM
jgi:hypothetical protein